MAKGLRSIVKLVNDGMDIALNSQGAYNAGPEIDERGDKHPDGEHVIFPPDSDGEAPAGETPHERHDVT